MKKIILCLILIFTLTGCIKNEDFNKACTYQTKTLHLSDNTEINVTYDNKDVIKKALVIRNYKALDSSGIDTLKSIKEANTTYNNKYGGMDIKVFVSKDSEYEYEIKYDLDVQKLDKDVLEDFKLKKNSIRFFNKMKEENIECEVK